MSMGEGVSLWSRKKSSAARATVRRAVVEALASVRERSRDATKDDCDRCAWEAGAITMAGEILRRLGLRGIGREVVAGVVRDLTQRERALPEPRR